MSIISIDVIKQQLCDRLDELVQQLFPNATADGPHEWVMGNVHGAPGRSLSIRRDGPKAGWWRDFGGSDRGDVITLIAAGACDGDVKAAIPWAIDWLGLGQLSPADRQRAEERARRTRAKAEREAQDKLAQLRRAAKGHFLGGAPILNSPADRYLLGRSIDLRALGHAPRCLSYKLMRCPETGESRPCMLASAIGASGDLLTIHRTFLQCHPDGRVTKAPMRNPKRAYCEFRGGVIPLWKGSSGKPLKRMSAGEWLTICEGIEDGLSIAQARPDMRVLSAISLANIGSAWLPEQVGGVIVAADNDKAEEAQLGLNSALRRLAERGIATRVVRAPEPHKDFNDWMRALVLQQAARAAS